jgi:hypothetical protein
MAAKCMGQALQCGLTCGYQIRSARGSVLVRVNWKMSWRMNNPGRFALLRVQEVRRHSNLNYQVKNVPRDAYTAVVASFHNKYSTKLTSVPMGKVIICIFVPEIFCLQKYVLGKKLLA